MTAHAGYHFAENFPRKEPMFLDEVLSPESLMFWNLRNDELLLECKNDQRVTSGSSLSEKHDTELH